MLDKIKFYWDWIQSLLDIDGDCIMLCYTAAIIYKTLHCGLNAYDAAAYASAVGCFAYSNKGKQS